MLFHPSERVCQPSVRFEEFRMVFSLGRTRSISLADDSAEEGASSLIADETVRLPEWLALEFYTGRSFEFGLYRAACRSRDLNSALKGRW
jgi:hypothetical protein